MDTHTKPSAYMDDTNTCNISNNITIPYIPLNNWVNVTMTLYGSRIDVYINGIVSKSIVLEGVPKQNNGDVYIGSSRGFTGKISNLRYYSRKLYVNEIEKLVKTGPNKKSLDSENEVNNYNYVSFNWYTNNV
jgi:hypothetical protein